VKPKGQLRLVGRLGDLPVDHVLVELLQVECERVAALFEGLVDPDHVGEQLTLVVEVANENLKGQAGKERQHPAADPPTCIVGIE